MEVRYDCPRCGKTYARLPMHRVSEQKLGISALTDEERADIISVDPSSGAMTVRCCCEECANTSDDGEPEQERWVH